MSEVEVDTWWIKKTQDQQREISHLLEQLKEAKAIIEEIVDYTYVSGTNMNRAKDFLHNINNIKDG